MAEKQDYYKVLELEKTATADQIKKSYKKLAMKYHPDRNQDNKEEAEAQFKLVKEAYEVLSDPNKRSRYDQFGHNDNPHHGHHGHGGFNPFDADIFSSFFHQHTAQNQQQVLTIELTLEESILGCIKPIAYSTQVDCDACHGTGSADNEVEICHACNGQGSFQRQTPMGMTVTFCNVCGGQGKKIKNPCKACNGHKKVFKAVNTTIKVPECVDNGTQLRDVKNNLVIIINVVPHARFKRNGLDLHMNVEVDAINAVLGCSQTIEMLFNNEQIKLTIPKGIQHDQVLRVPNKGVTKPGHKSGHVYCHIKITIPTNLTDEQLDKLKSVYPEEL
jgi:molecular chaperone DnaJ